MKASVKEGVARNGSFPKMIDQMVTVISYYQKPKRILLHSYIISDSPPYFVSRSRFRAPLTLKRRVPLKNTPLNSGVY